jgi:hypothetical protein
MSFKHLAVGGVVCAALLVAAPAGFAQTAGQTGYSEPAGSVQQRLGHDEPAANTATRGDPGGNGSVGLPFTGLDLGLIGGAGGMLLAIGLAVRRVVGSATP